MGNRIVLRMAVGPAIACCWALVSAVIDSNHNVAYAARESTSVDWKTMMPKVRSALQKQFHGEVGEHYDIGILRPGHIADVTGDGIPEALVWLGTGGASTSELALMRMDHDQPVVALFKDQQGKIEPMTFPEGSSVTHSDGVDLVPKEHALFHHYFERLGDGKLGTCGGEAYRWNPHTKIFTYDARSSARLSRDYCHKVSRSDQ